MSRGVKSADLRARYRAAADISSLLFFLSFFSAFCFFVLSFFRPLRFFSGLGRARERDSDNGTRLKGRNNDVALCYPRKVGLYVSLLLFSTTLRDIRASRCAE